MTASPTRRQSLIVGPSPAGKQDFLIQLEQLLWLGSGSVHLVLRYVPNEDILDAASLETYTEQYKNFPSDQLETLVAMLQEDLSNILIPRFLHIELAASTANVAHRVVVEERQPGWDNTALIARMKVL